MLDMLFYLLLKKTKRRTYASQSVDHTQSIVEALLR